MNLFSAIQTSGRAIGPTIIPGYVQLAPAVGSLISSLRSLPDRAVPPPIFFLLPKIEGDRFCSCWGAASGGEEAELEAISATVASGDGRF